MYSLRGQIMVEWCLSMGCKIANYTADLYIRPKTVHFAMDFKLSKSSCFTNANIRRDEIKYKTSTKSSLLSGTFYTTVQTIYSMYFSIMKTMCAFYTMQEKQRSSKDPVWSKKKKFSLHIKGYIFCFSSLYNTSTNWITFLCCSLLSSWISLKRNTT